MKYRIKARIKKSDDNIVEFNVLARKLPTEVLSVASADLPEHVLSEIKGWGDRREHIVRGELDLLAENPTVSNWDTVKKVETVGHQAPKGLRGDNRFSRVDIRGDFAYCVSHNFVYNPEVEEEKLYNAKPCYYTDGRYVDGRHNSYKDATLYWRRFENASLKKCCRMVRQCYNIPVGTIVDITTSWYWPTLKASPNYRYKVRKENKLAVEYEINLPGYTRNFVTCERSRILTDKLRAAGFLVKVSSANPDFIMGMIKTASAYVGNTEIADSNDPGESAVAYGFGKKIGFSSGNHPLYGYRAGELNILWDRFGEFDKWSRCAETPKTTDPDEVVKILIEK